MISKKYEIKDFFFLVPGAATAVALSYNIGFFFGIGLSFLSLFTIAEHLLFALYVLPFGIMFSFIFLMFLCAAGVPNIRSMASRIRRIASLSTVQMISFGLVGILTTLAVVYRENPSWIILAEIAIMIWLGLALIRSEADTNAGLVYAILCSLFLTFSFGFFVGRRQHSPSSPTKEIIITPSGKIPARIIRSGDRGILLYRTDTKVLVVIPWRFVNEIVRQND